MRSRPPSRDLKQPQVQRPTLIQSFTRSQLSSFVATVFDYLVMVCLVEFFSVWSVEATAIGSFCGAITHFLFGRYWSFSATDGGIHSQAIKYSIISALSLLINTYGVYFLTESYQLHYAIARTFVAFTVGIFFNFPLHRGFVFKTSVKKENH